MAQGPMASGQHSIPQSRSFAAKFLRPPTNMQTAADRQKSLEMIPTLQK